jgi:NDP-sugar pyrophosphorylase family protein/histidinol phosphatase-like enzyme
MISQAVILCGGLGTRLGALTVDTPKPLLEVGGRPFIEILLFELARHGFRRILLLAGFAGQRIVEYVASSRIAQEFGLELDVVVEGTPAGTGGSLWLARSRLEAEFLLMNGDSWFDINLRALTARLLVDPKAAGILALRHVEDGFRYGTVSVSGNRIVRYAARPTKGGPALVSAGVYAFRRSFVNRLVTHCSLEQDVLPGLADSGLLLGFIQDGYFIDIGIPEDLTRARQEIANVQRRPAALLSLNNIVLLSGEQDIGRYCWAADGHGTVKRLNDCGYFVFIVENEATLRGPFDENHVYPSYSKLQEELAAAGAHIDCILPGLLESDNAGMRNLSEVSYLGASKRTISELVKFWPIDMSKSFFTVSTENQLITARQLGVAAYRVAQGELNAIINIILRAQTR